MFYDMMLNHVFCAQLHHLLRDRVGGASIQFVDIDMAQRKYVFARLFK